MAALFGAGSGLSRTVYIAVGVSAAAQLVPLLSTFGGGRVTAERG